MKKIFGFITLCLLFVSAFAANVPAKREFITVQQPNGKLLTYVLIGDEVMSWCETKDGYTLLRNPEGVLCYAEKDSSGDLVASCIIACNSEQREVEELVFLDKIEKKLFWSERQLEEFAKRRRAMHQSPSETAD